MSPIKHNADSMQNSSTVPSHSKGKKRNRIDQTSESRKKENSLRHYVGDTVQLRSDNLLKSEIQKLTENGLVDADSVDKLLQLMQPDKSHRKLDLSFRGMLAGILAATERLDCLNLFLQRLGLPILDEWLKEVHKGKVGSTAKDGDKEVEDFLLVLLDALDKLPVNLNALKMCNIGKSVNQLRSHKKLEIQKKARGLVDTWKQRVEAEMNNNDAKSSSSQEVTVPDKSKNEVSYDWKKQSSTSSEAVTKSSGQLTSSKSAAVKLVQGETTLITSSASSGIEKSSSPPGSASANLKQGQMKKSTFGGCSEPQTTIRGEKSSTSSQSHTNSQFSNDHARKSGKEDANSSTAGSRNMSKKGSRHKKPANGLQQTTPSGAENKSGANKQSTLLKNLASEKVSQSTITCDNALATPVAKSNKMILKIHNRGCSPGKISVAGSVNELPCTKSRASSPALSGKCDQVDAVLKNKSSNHQTDKVVALPDPLPVPCETGKNCLKLPDVPEGTPKAEKGSEANTSVTVRDDIGMNLLASVASGEMSRSGNVLLSTSPLRSTATAHKPSANNEGEVTKNSNGAESSSGTRKKLDGFVGEASIATTSACTLGKVFIDDIKQICTEAASIKGEKDSVTDVILATAGSMDAEHLVKDGSPFEEEETGDSSLPCVSTLTNVHDRLLANSSDADLLVEGVAKLKAGDSAEVDASGFGDVKTKQGDENNASNSGPIESSSNSDKKIDCKNDIPESSVGSPAKVLSSTRDLESQLSSKNCGLVALIEEKKDKQSAAAATTTGVPNLDEKFDFDLNEGFNMDEMRSGEPIDFAAPSLPTSTSFMGSYSSLSSTSVSVAAAAERPFVPSEDLLRNEPEVGCKRGAFHPAELRMVLELSSGSNKAPPLDGMACKQVRPLLEIDLNVTDESILQDISIQNAAMKFNHKPDDKFNSNNDFMGSRLSHYCDGFELDLNRIDEAPESERDSAGRSLRTYSFSSIAPALFQASKARDFDLNNGPALDDKNFEPLGTLQAHSNNTSQPHFGLRMNNNPTISSMSLWDSPGTTYSAVTIATPLPDRGDLSFPRTTAGPSQRILSGLTSGMPYNPDFYRGPALSSSPAGMAFATAPLQYPVFPFGSSFPLPASSLPGGSAVYMDPSLAARFYAPAIPGQLVGSAAAVSSQYMHPTIVRIPDIGRNSFGQGIQNSGRQGQGLDLNSGPGTLDVEGRDKALNISARQFNAVSQFPDGLSKRKEPHGGWDGDGNSYKQSSWR